MMFTPEERHRLRGELLAHAAKDNRVTAGAITGSGAAAAEDRWSDIDLAFGVVGPEDLSGVLADWTTHMQARYGALHHLDVKSGAWTYRVFILPNTLQVDLAFVPAAEFRALAPSFKLVFGTAQSPAHAAPVRPEDLIGLAWLYALHARTCIARGQLWRAEYMISAQRDHALALACVRHGLPAVQGRGIDSLPADVAAQFRGALVRELECSELLRAFRVAVDGLLAEIRHVDDSLAERLQEALVSLTETSK